MNAALLRISGEGDLESGWKRLFGCNRALPSDSSTGFEPEKSPVSFWTRGAAALNEELALRPAVPRPSSALFNGVGEALAVLVECCR
jgi:hypothetical protein